MFHAETASMIDFQLRHRHLTAFLCIGWLAALPNQPTNTCRACVPFDEISSLDDILHDLRALLYHAAEARHHAWILYLLHCDEEKLALQMPGDLLL